MSVSYNLVCLSCHECSESVPYGKSNIKKFIANWSENKSAISKVLELELIDIGYLQESFYSKSIPTDIYEFMLKHEKHELVIRSEYFPNEKDEIIVI